MFQINNDLSGSLECSKSEVKPVHHVNIANCQIVSVNSFVMALLALIMEIWGSVPLCA
jgi:hypothetical protein